MNDVIHFFLCLLAVHVFFCEVSIYLLPIFYCFFLSFVIELYILSILDRNSLQIYVLQIFLLICSLPIHFLNSIFEKQIFLMLMFI